MFRLFFTLACLKKKCGSYFQHNYFHNTLLLFFCGGGGGEGGGGGAGWLSFPENNNTL